MTCASKFHAIIISRVLESFAMTGVATWGEVYVPIPALKIGKCKFRLHIRLDQGIYIPDSRSSVDSCHLSGA